MLPLRGLTRATVAATASATAPRTLTTSAARFSAPKAPNTPVTTAGHYGSHGDESQGRNLPSEQKERENLSVDAHLISDAPREYMRL